MNTFSAYHQLLYESIDSKPAKWKRTLNQSKNTEYEFTINIDEDEKIEYYVHFVKFGDKDKREAEVTFSTVEDDGLFKLTGKGHVGKVLNTVVDVIKDFIKTNKDMVAIEFMSSKDGKRNPLARTNIYKRVLERELKKIPGWEKESINQPTFTVFRIRRKK